MAVNWRIVTLMLMNLILILQLLATWFHTRRQKNKAQGSGPVTLIAADHGGKARKSLSQLLAPAGSICSKEISPEAGAYVLGSNPLGRIFPRYIYFRDGSARGIKLVLVIADNGTLSMSVLKGNMRFEGLVYRPDKQLVLTLSKGDSFWLGQSEIKVR